MDTSEKIKVTPVIDNKINITCPKCMKTTMVDLNRKTSLLDKLIVGYKCTCGDRRKIKLEKRNVFRKDTRLKGKIKKTGKFLGSIYINNLSRSGLKFEANHKTKLEIGDRLELEFRLDDKKQSLIRQEGIIRNADTHLFGVEFIGNCNKEYDRRLGFYFL